MWKAFIAALVLSVLAGFAIEAHPHFAVEAFFGAYALYGFFACAALILGAKALGLLIKRPDSYYDE